MEYQEALSNSSVSGALPFVRTESSSSRRRRRGAAAARLAQEASAKASVGKHHGWHESMEAASIAAHRKWGRDMGWIGYKEKYEEDYGDGDTFASSSKIHVPLHVASKSPGTASRERRGRNMNKHEKNMNGKEICFPAVESKQPTTRLADADDFWTDATRSLATGTTTTDQSRRSGDGVSIVAPMPPQIHRITHTPAGRNSLDMKPSKPQIQSDGFSYYSGESSYNSILAPSSYNSILAPSSPSMRKNSQWVKSMERATANLAEHSWDPRYGFTTLDTSDVMSIRTPSVASQQPQQPRQQQLSAAPASNNNSNNNKNKNDSNNNHREAFAKRVAEELRRNDPPGKTAEETVLKREQLEPEDDEMLSQIGFEVDATSVLKRMDAQKMIASPSMGTAEYPDDILGRLHVMEAQGSPDDILKKIDLAIEAHDGLKVSALNFEEHEDYLMMIQPPAPVMPYVQVRKEKVRQEELDLFRRRSPPRTSGIGRLAGCGMLNPILPETVYSTDSGEYRSFEHGRSVMGSHSNDTADEATHASSRKGSRGNATAERQRQGLGNNNTRNNGVKTGVSPGHPQPDEASQSSAQSSVTAGWKSFLAKKVKAENEAASLGRREQQPSEEAPKQEAGAIKKTVSFASDVVDTPTRKQLPSGGPSPDKAKPVQAALEEYELELDAMESKLDSLEMEKLSQLELDAMEEKLDSFQLSESFLDDSLFDFPDESFDAATPTQSSITRDSAPQRVMRSRARLSARNYRERMHSRDRVNESNTTISSIGLNSHQTRSLKSYQNTIESRQTNENTTASRQTYGNTTASTSRQSEWTETDSQVGAEAPSFMQRIYECRSGNTCRSQHRQPRSYNERVNWHEKSNQASRIVEDLLNTLRSERASCSRSPARSHGAESPPDSDVETKEADDAFDLARARVDAALETLYYDSNNA
ncbi:expressed unknown protein [Seminavis robusta]|uniref:Uncharacterized protein n=1 Tax=Seminavis robusta TaxID=568900 RepID=A0A9N8EGM7_9STRA|nr:expressed unknown protein [Seminavis robusta]|eukprot:Sro972_g226540.1 n/a (930) ;mRNA; f:1023-3812